MKYEFTVCPLVHRVFFTLQSMFERGGMRFNLTNMRVVLLCLEFVVVTVKNAETAISHIRRLQMVESSQLCRTVVDIPATVSQ